MGIYLFKTEVLKEILQSDKGDDFGRDIIPNLLNLYRVYAYSFSHRNRIRDYVYTKNKAGERRLKVKRRIRDSAYWRDVGTLDSYWNANMDLTGVDPYFNLYGRMWPIHTHQIQVPPAKFIFANERPKNFRVGKALDSLVSSG